MAINLDNIRGVTVLGKDIRQIIRPRDEKILWAGEHYIICSNCGANQTVTAVHSSGRTYTATSDSSGNAAITVYDDGDFTVSTPYYSQSKTVNVPASEESVSMRFRYYLYAGAVISPHTLTKEPNVYYDFYGPYYGEFTNADGRLHFHSTYHVDYLHGDRFGDAIFHYFEPIDLSGYSTISADMELTTDGSGACRNSGIIISGSRLNGNIGAGYQPPTPTLGNNGRTAISRGVYTADISSITGSKYIYLGTARSYDNGYGPDLYVYSLYLD